MFRPRGSPLFALVVLIALGLYAAIGVMVVLMQLRPGFMGMAHGTELHHRVHDLTFGFLLAPAAMGLLVQLGTPARNFASQLMALIPWIALLLAFALAATWIVFAPAPVLAALTLVATILHPARRASFRSFSLARANPVMLGLVGIAAVPLLVFAAGNIGLQRTLTNDHALLGHYGFMAAFGFTVIGIGLLASLRLDGSWIPIGVAGLLPVLLAAASLLYPGNDSSLGFFWSVAAIMWGIAFVAVAALTGRSATDTDHITAPEPVDEIASSRLQPLKLLGIATLVLAMLFAVLHITGGPGRH